MLQVTSTFPDTTGQPHATQAPLHLGASWFEFLGSLCSQSCLLFPSFHYSLHRCLKVLFNLEVCDKEGLDPGENADSAPGCRVVSRGFEGHVLLPASLSGTELGEAQSEVFMQLFFSDTGAVTWEDKFSESRCRWDEVSFSQESPSLPRSPSFPPRPDLKR